MASKLEQLAIIQRDSITNPNLYKLNWKEPLNVSNNYSVVHTRAISDTKTPIHGKGTGIFLDTENGGGEYDINGNPNHVGSGRVNALNINTYNKLSFYDIKHSRALSDDKTPYNGKGTNDSSILNEANSFVLAAHTNYKGGNRYDIEARNGLMNNPFNPYNLNNQYSVSNPRAISSGDIHGKGENPKLNGKYLNDTHNYTTIGSKDDIDARNSTSSGVNTNIYRPDTTSNVPSVTNNQYGLSHKNALATGDLNGKGTNDGISIDGTYAAHTNYKGGNNIDIQKRIEANKKNVISSNVNKPFGYGYNEGEDYLTNRPLYNDDSNKVNVGKIVF